MEEAKGEVKCEKFSNVFTSIWTIYLPKVPIIIIIQIMLINLFVYKVYSKKPSKYNITK